MIYIRQYVANAAKASREFSTRQIDQVLVSDVSGTPHKLARSGIESESNPEAIRIRISQWSEPFSELGYRWVGRLGQNRPIFFAQFICFLPGRFSIIYVIFSSHDETKWIWEKET